ncbi:hypothetical protein SteCoe_18869 [Stentor coeruleus]|uniref:SH3 domain-containing protein n=1 Tax=Stentor coeruleus TaxID=5963 RepID=A0A1R2BVH3_9CILI|nr:hypothetical protein SteCoe_18869 [Stentor coeruleus]
MSFKLPNKLKSKRANSFHYKKTVTPAVYSNEDTDFLIPRHKSITPYSTKSGQRISLFDMKNSSSVSSKPNTTFEIPKTHKLDIRAGSVIEYKSNYFNDLIEKFTTNHKQNYTKPNDEIKKLEEKHAKKVQDLNLEIEKLKNQILKLKIRRNNDKKKEKIIQDLKEDLDLYKKLTETFVGNIRKNIEKLCSFITSISPKSYTYEINTMFAGFNENLEILVPFISHDAIIDNQFHICCNDALENTGKFKSLAETQNSFGNCVESNGVKEVIAMANFEPNYYGELGFKTGDRIQLVKTDETAWWLGKIGEKIGRIPSELIMLD